MVSAVRIALCNDLDANLIYRRIDKSDLSLEHLQNDIDLENRITRTNICSSDTLSITNPT